MSEEIFDQEDGGFSFTDQDFERRYYSRETSVRSSPGSGNPSLPVSRQAHPGADPIGLSRNKFMRTLLRRRFFSSTPL